MEQGRILECQNKACNYTFEAIMSVGMESPTHRDDAKEALESGGQLTDVKGYHPAICPNCH